MLPWSRRQLLNPIKPFYFNSEVIAAIRCRNQFKCKYYATKDPNDWEKYRQQRNRVVSLRRKAIKEHFAKQCSASTGNPRKFWSVFKPYLFSRKNQTSESIQLAEGETIFQEQSKIEDILNNHFLSGISAPTVPDPKNHHSIFIIKNNFSPTEVFNFSSVSESVVAELLKSLNIRKATGCDLIPPRALKEGYPSLSRPICSLVNQIITRMEIPSFWKQIGEVLPFLKSGDAMDKTNYRPVTILRAISKVFEKCLCPQLTSYFETIFPTTLTAYRKNHSCCTTLLRLTEDWKIEADLNNIIGATLIHLSKAFDRLPHNLLLAKLSAYGVSLEGLELLTNYVKNRTQCVRLGNTRSTTGKLTSGVPQGSVLGPHLFNIFINDLFYNIKKARILAYADDKQLYFNNANARIVQKTLNSELAVVSSWITHNGLLLNPKKCESLIFRRINSKSNQTEGDKINFSVDGTLIEPSTMHLQITGGAHR